MVNSCSAGSSENTEATTGGANSRYSAVQSAEPESQPPSIPAASAPPEENSTALDLDTEGQRSTGQPPSYDEVMRSKDRYCPVPPRPPPFSEA